MINKVQGKDEQETKYYCNRTQRLSIDLLTSRAQRARSAIVQVCVFLQMISISSASKLENKF